MRTHQAQDTLRAKLAMLQSNLEAERAEHAEHAARPTSVADDPAEDAARLHIELQDALAAKQALAAQLQELQGNNRKILAGVSQLHSTLVSSRDGPGGQVFLHCVAVVWC